MPAPITTAVGKNNVLEIRTLITRNEIHAIPIIQYVKQLPNTEVTIRGIITGKEMNGKTIVEDVMSSKVHVIHKDSSANAAAKMMLKHKVHHLVAIMDDGKIIGMVSSLDIVKLVAEHNLD